MTLQLSKGVTKVRIPNLIIGIVVIGIGLFFIANTLSFPNITLEPMGPAFMPRMYGAILIFLGLILAITTLKEKKKEENENEEKNMKYVLLSMLIVLTYVLLIPYFGFYIATLAFSVVFLIFSKVYNKIVLVSVPIGTVLLIYVFFDKILKVAIPLGSLFS